MALKAKKWASFWGLFYLKIFRCFSITGHIFRYIYSTIKTNKIMATNKNIFNYSGFIASRMSVQIEGYSVVIYIERIDSGEYTGKFEAYTEGGSYGVFKTLGKAISFAEKNLTEIKKNNPED